MANENIDKILDSFVGYLEHELVIQNSYGENTAEKAKRFILLLSGLNRYMVYWYLGSQLGSYKDDIPAFIDELCSKLEVNPAELSDEHEKKITRFLEFFVEVLC